MEAIVNPDKLSFGQLWGSKHVSKYEGYLGNEGATKSSLYLFALDGSPGEESDSEDEEDDHEGKVEVIVLDSD
ncbi:hypothetical protein HK098_006406 [Nowakowskiella sp. JEL0407]|nr:hypothetical protein HK098_006406 [Nowakowskiella sp. JEL0407]